MIENSKTIPHELLGFKWSEIHYNLIKKIMDGNAYSTTDLKIYDDHTSDNTIQFHIKMIRKKLVHTVYRIHSGHEKNILVYRLVKLLPTAH